MGPTSFGTFFVRNMGKIVPHQNKNTGFGKLTKSVFTVNSYAGIPKKVKGFKNLSKFTSKKQFWCSDKAPVFGYKSISLPLRGHFLFSKKFFCLQNFLATDLGSYGKNIRYDTLDLQKIFF